jgi:protocatechuate 3,4-dioxygenase beta subunit
MDSKGKGNKSRRAVIEGAAAVVGATLVGWSRSGGAGAAPSRVPSPAGPTPAAGPRSGASAVRASQATTLTPADFADLGPCQVLPEQTQGPFYADLDLMRRDITEGLPGHPLRLGVQVVDENCDPIPEAVVDVWHCDVDGDYSAFADGTPNDAGPGTTFLRGSQTTNADGIAEIHTNYPGWYTGRAVHIHTKVHLDATTALTTQLYLPDELTDEVHREAPYAAHGQRTIRNADDFIAAGSETNGTLVTTSAEGDGTLGLVVIGVRPGQQQQQCNVWDWLMDWLNSMFTGQPRRCA